MRAMLIFTKQQWRLFEHLRRKHNVSKEFLQYNLNDIQKFLWYEIRPRIIIRRYAIRKGNRVYLEYYRLRRILYDQNNRKVFERKRQNIKQWSNRMVTYLRRLIGVQEYVVEEPLSTKEIGNNRQLTSAEDITKKLKKQLELLKNGRRPTTLMLTHNEIVLENNNDQNSMDNNDKGNEYDYHNDGGDDVTCKTKCISLSIVTSEQANSWQNSLELTPEKQLTPAPGPDFLKAIQEQQQQKQRRKLANFCSSSDITEDSRFEEELNNNNLETQEQQMCLNNNSGNFLDVLMSKVVIGSDNNINHDNSKGILKDTLQTKENSCETLASLDSTDGFLGFDETERVPGMLMTPIVPQSNKNQNENSAFVSEILNEYMRVNALESFHSNNEQCNLKDEQHYHSQQKQKSQQSSIAIFKKTDLEGLVTPNCVPPVLHMPVVPETLLKLRTVADRKQYLQKFSKNHRLSIINNEAVIYRELQRKLKTCKMKSTSQTLYQSNNSPMSFTRNGWQAASFINTEFYKYYYQMIDIDHGKYSVRLRGVYGSNEYFHKKPHVSYMEPRLLEAKKKCPENCLDLKLCRNFKIIKTIMSKSPKTLIKDPLHSILKPCPLLHKPFQKPLDDDTAALLLAGGSMTVVRMPLIELEVFPEHGKPLHEIAKRYLQYILPHHDISREWAEFSVSALQTQNVKCSGESTGMSKPLRKSFTFIIPYNNDRDQVLVRRVVDRSEKLDTLFENTIDMNLHERILKENFMFRRSLLDLPNTDRTYAIALDCANVLSDMINTVAISCSENSFIKEDPHGLYHTNSTGPFGDRNMQSQMMQQKTSLSVSSPASSSSSPPLSTSSCGGWPSVGNNKKQNRLLSELKRLNATIIDAAVKKDDGTKCCSKEYCALGCICPSLEGGHPMRDHCGKAKCMLECTCKAAPQSRIMRLETDGRCITTEDAFMLRRKATARLARMEKEFTSTVVLSGNETFLINETNNDKKRRCTKAPKRYEDIRDTERDDEQVLLNQKHMPKKISSKLANNITNSATTPNNNTTNAIELLSQSGNTIFNNNDKSTDCVAIDLEDWEEPIFVKDTTLKQLKHCTVNLVRLEDTSNMVPWCMIHGLYKCFCKGRAVDGKPFIIEKDESNSTIAHNNNNSHNNNNATGSLQCGKRFKRNDNGDNSCNSSNDNNITDNKMPLKRKIKRVEKSEKRSTKYDRNVDLTNIDMMQNNFDDDNTKSAINQIKSKRKAYDINEIDNDSDGLVKRKRISMEDVKLRYYNDRLGYCRRLIPIPRYMYLQKNRLRRHEIISKIQRDETSETRLLLNEHIMRSVYYHHAENTDGDATATSGSGSATNSGVSYKHAQTSTDKQKAILNTKWNQTPVTTTETTTTSNESVPGHYAEQDPEKLLQMLFSIPQGNFTSLNMPNNESQERLQGVIELLDDDDDTENNGNSYSNNTFNLERSMNDYAAPGNRDQQQQQDQLSSSSSSSSSSSVDALLNLKEFESVCNDNGNGTVTAATTSNLINNRGFSLNLIPTTTATVTGIGTATSTVTAINAAAVSTSTSIDCVNTDDATHHETEKTPQKAKQHVTPVTNARHTMVALAKELNMSNEDFQSLYNDVIRSMNGMVCRKMYDISETFKRDSITLPQPRPGVLCVMRWSNFLAAFMQQCMFMWQVKMENERKFLVVTLNNMMPLVVDALGVVNVMALNTKKLPFMARMLIMHFQNEETQNLGTVMQGKATYWLVKGFIRGDARHACFKPNPQTRPRLTKKINMLCCLLLRQRVRQEKLKILKKQNAALASDSPEDESNNNTDVVSGTADIIKNGDTAASASTSTNNLSIGNTLNQPTTTPTSIRTSIDIGIPSNDMNALDIDSHKNKRNLDSSFACISNTATAINLIDISNQTITEAKQQINDNCSRTIPVAVAAAAVTETTTANALATAINSTTTVASTTSAKTKPLLSTLNRFKVRSNIEIRKIVQSDVDELHLPETHKYDHKWLVLDLHDDFTHIFLPELKELLSLNRIDKVVAFAKEKLKIIKMQFCSSAPFDVFATPNSGRKVYVGPLKLNADQPLLILLQSFNGKMMMREIYQQKYKNNSNNNVNKNDKKTTAFWLLSIRGQMHLEVDINDSCINDIMMGEVQQQQQQPNNPEDTNTHIDKGKITDNSKPNLNVSFNSNNNNNNNDDYNEDDDDCMIIENVPSLKDESKGNVSITQQQQQQHINTEKRLNFTIETVNNNEILQITPESNAVIVKPKSLEHSIKPIENNNTVITQLPSNVSPHTLQHLTANNTSIKAFNHAQIRRDTSTVSTIALTTVVTTIVAKPSMPVTITSGLTGKITPTALLTAETVVTSSLTATKTIQSLSAPIIAPTTSDSVLITKIAATLDSLAAPTNRSSLSSSKLISVSESTSALSSPIILNKVQCGGSMTTVTTKSNGMPIISSVYSFSTTGSMIGSMKNTVTTATAGSSLQHKIIRRRFPLGPINKITLVATTATLTATTAATTILKATGSSAGIEGGRALTTTTNCNGQSQRTVDAAGNNVAKYLTDAGINLNVVTTSNPAVQTICCTTITKLTDSTTILTTNTNVTTTTTVATTVTAATAIEPSTKIMQKSQQSTKNNITIINKTVVRDYQSRQQKRINNYNNALLTTKTATVPSLASVSTTVATNALTMTNSPGNLKVLYRQPIKKATTLATGAEATIACGTSLQTANKQQKLQAQPLSKVLITNNGNCGTLDSITLGPPSSLVLNNNTSAAIASTKSNDNNNVTKLHARNRPNQMKVDNNDNGSKLRNENTKHSISNSASLTPTIFNSLSEVNKQRITVATTMTPTLIQKSNQPPPLLLQKSQQQQQQLPQLLPLSSAYTPSLNKTICKTRDNQDSALCLESKIKSNIIIKRCSVGTMPTSTISSVNSSSVTSAANLHSATKPLFVLKPMQLKGHSVSSASTSAGGGLYYGKAVTTATITTTTAAACSKTTTATATRATVIPIIVSGSKPVPFQHNHQQQSQQRATTTVCKTVDALPKLALITPRGASIITEATTIPTKTIIAPSTVTTAKQMLLQQHFPQQRGTLTNCSTSNSPPSLTLITPTMITTNVVKVTTTTTATQRAPIAHKRSSGNATAAALTYLSTCTSTKPTTRLFYSANTNNETTTADATAVNVCPPPYIQYGYVIAPNIDKRFVAKRVKCNYFVKLPNDGIKRFEQMANVSTYLNKYLSTDNDCIGKLPAMWKFLPASQTIQMQNYKKSLIRKHEPNDISHGITPNGTNQIGHNTDNNNHNKSSNSNAVMNSDGLAKMNNSSCVTNTTSITSTVSITSTTSIASTSNTINTTSITSTSSSTTGTTNVTSTTTSSTISTSSSSTSNNSAKNNPIRNVKVTTNNRRKKSVLRRMNATVDTSPVISETILIDD